MRVLFLAHAYPRHATDPVGSFVGNLAVALHARDVHVTVSAPAAPGLAAFEQLAGIPVHRFRYAPARHETLAYTGTMGAQVRGTVAGKATMLAYLAAEDPQRVGRTRREMPAGPDGQPQAWPGCVGGAASAR